MSCIASIQEYIIICKTISYILILLTILIYIGLSRAFNLVLCYIFMYFFLKFYFDFIKLYSIIIVFLTLFLLLFNICFPHEVFAMEPSKDIVEDYYGNKEYIRKDSYGHFNPSGSSNNYPNSVQPDLKPPYSPQLGPSKPVVSEDDIGFSSHNSVFSLYLTMKRKTY